MISSAIPVTERLSVPMLKSPARDWPANVPDYQPKSATGPGGRKRNASLWLSALWSTHRIC